MMDVETNLRILSYLTMTALSVPFARLADVLRMAIKGHNDKEMAELLRQVSPADLSSKLERVTGNMGRVRGVQVVEFRSETSAEEIWRIRYKLPDGLTLDDLTAIAKGLRAGCQFSRRGLSSYISQGKYAIVYNWFSAQGWLSDTDTPNVRIKGQALALLNSLL